MTNKSIDEIIDTDYKEYSLYTLYNRAIPSAIDGFKPVHRFVLYGALQGKDPYTVKKKLSEFGACAAFGYHHGEVSAVDAAIKMTAEWQNNVPVFKGYGSFGSRLVNEAAAPRYIFASVNPIIKNIFVDSDIAPRSDDEETLTPKHYLPIVPWVLINGVRGVAVGFATLILPRSIKDVSDAVKKYLKNPTKFDLKEIKPTFPQFYGKVTKDDAKGRWVSQGVVTQEKNYFIISELPYGVDRQTYIKFLDKLEDQGKIDSYEDDCSDRFGFRVKVSRSQKELIDDPISFFDLETYYTENLTTIDHEGKLKVFSNVGDLIAYFCEYRLSMFGKKIDLEISNTEFDIAKSECRMKFIKAVIAGKIDLKKSTKADVINFIKKNVTAEEFGEDFVNIQFYRFTTEYVDKLQQEIDSMKDELAKLKQTTPTNRFEELLKGIK